MSVSQSGSAIAADIRFVVPLAGLNASMINLVGGKAANLGELMDAALPVPPGFCLTVAAYRQAVGDRVSQVAGKLAAVDGGEHELIAELAAQARMAILDAPVPPAIAAQITAAYSELAGADETVPVAVRSSATAEDLPQASFAGQQDSYLNVIGPDAVVAAVRRCWASLWTDRAVTYRIVNGIDQAAVSLAVIIQRMVMAEVAGVMFTAHPLTGCRSQTVIDASPGLGEAVVSGAVNPDHFVLDTASGAVIDTRLGDKAAIVAPVPGGGTEHASRAPDESPCLDATALVALSRLGERAQRHFGVPQDLEWALDVAGRPWLTQSRPVTTLFPLPSDDPGATERLRVYFCYSLAWQGLHRPVTPLGLSVLRLYCSSVARMYGMAPADPLAGPRAFADPGQRMYLDITGAMRTRAGRRVLYPVLAMVDTPTANIVRSLYDHPGLGPLRAGDHLGLRMLVILLRYGVPLRLIEAIVSPSAARARLARLSERLRRDLAEPADPSPAGRLAAAERAILDQSGPLLPRMIPPSAAGGIMIGLSKRLLGDELTNDALTVVLRGLPHNVTTEMDLDVWRLAAQIRQDPQTARLVAAARADDLARAFREGSLPETARAGLRRFLDRYGHRAVAEIDAGMPRWSEDPAQVLDLVISYLNLADSAHTPQAQFAQGAKDAAAMVGTLVAHARARGAIRARAARFTLGRVRELMGLREYTKYHTVLVLAYARAQIGQIGAVLAADGRLDDPSDVFYLCLEEIHRLLAGVDYRAVIARRRARYARELTRRQVPRVLLSDGTQPETQLTGTVDADGALIGTPASSGLAAGNATVVLDPVGAIVRPGEILVVPSTDPGWTPLFLHASGLVMEVGGVNSHGAVVAREYGIPAVVGVPRATELITAGQPIVVDGSAGTVTLR